MRSLREKTAAVRLNPAVYPKFDSFGIVLGLLVSFAFLATLAQSGETNSLTAKNEPPIRHSLPTPQEVAAQHERAGRKREAAAVYEEMARTNNAARKVLSHRLVKIYTETGEANKALIWAHEVMRESPDGEAFLAAVYTRLGQAKEAREILEHEIARNTNTTRAVTLRWQLADVYEKAGDGLKARRILNEATEAAKGTAMESAAWRLKTLKELAK